MRPYVLLSVIVLASLMGCRVRESEPKHRPAEVPSNAFWTTLGNNGAYVTCSGPSERHTYYCRIWKDTNGELVDSGYFEDSYGPARNAPLNLTGADVRQPIRLQNGTKVYPINH